MDINREHLNPKFIDIIDKIEENLHPMENISNEIKAKVYGQYLGQKFKDKDGFIFTLSTFNLNELYYLKCFKNLLLKPLSAISDEDAIEAVMIHEKEAFNIALFEYQLIFKFHYGQEVCSGAFDLNCLDYKIYQFLQSKGYDLCNYYLDGKTLFECGLCVYE